jgi:hypothetical protein
MGVFVLCHFSDRGRPPSGGSSREYTAVVLTTFPSCISEHHHKCPI